MFSTRRAFLAGAAGFVGLGWGSIAQEAEEKEGTETFFKVFPIGKVEKKDGTTRIRIHEKYSDALLGLDGWSHINVLYWFHKNDIPQKRGILRVHPRGNKKNPLTGVFACRAPVRPNLIALSVCKILSIKDNVITIDKIDAFDGTPILDIKPFIPPDSPKQGIRVPDWARNRER